MTKARAIVVTAFASYLGGLAIAGNTAWGDPAWWAIPLLVIVMAVAETASVRLTIGRQGYTLAVSDIAVAMAMVLAPGWWIVLSVAGYAFAHRRMSRLKLFYNVSNQLFSQAVGVAVTLAVGHGLWGAVAGLAAYSAINYSLVILVIWLASGTTLRRVLSDMAVLGVLGNTGNISIGVLAGWMAAVSPLALFGLAVPIIVLWWSLEQQTQRAAEARLFEELARGHEEMAGQSIDSSAQIVVTAAARLFGDAEVEMLLRHPDGPVQYIGDESGLVSRTRAEPDAFGAPWVLRALAARDVLAGLDGEQPFCSIVLGDRGSSMAVLIARRGERVAPFTHVHEQLATILAAQARSWLSVADLSARHDAAMGQVEAYGAASRVLGDIGAHTAPALLVLRESADRLSRLAYAFDGPDPLSDIVDELHAVERAVASLLGAISLASDAQFVGDGNQRIMGGSSMPRAETEWTTTGQLEVVPKQ